MFQIYWPNWYKLWPSYSILDNNDYRSMAMLLFYPEPIEHFLCFGALQIRWRTMPDINDIIE